MNNNFFRRPGLGRGFGRNRGLGRADRYLDEARIRDLDLYEVPLQRGGMRLRDGSCRMMRMNGLRDGLCRYPYNIGRGMYYQGQRLEEIKKEINEKKEQKEQR